MSSENKKQVGFIGWVDLTVPNAEQIGDFYRDVVGFKPEPVSMGDYNDFNMLRPEDGKPGAGVCHARGCNANQPTGWMVYFNVKNLDESLEKVKSSGGTVLVEPSGEGSGRFGVIRDPAGAVCALYQP